MTRDQARLILTRHHLWTGVRAENLPVRAVEAAEALGELEQEVERLRAALAEYGQHASHCDGDYSSRPCHCGFRDVQAALTHASQAAPEGEGDG